MRRATATNNRKKDARLLYMMELASSRLPRAMELCTFVGGNRDDFFLQDVMRNCFALRTKTEPGYD